MKPVGDSGFLMGDVELGVGPELVGSGVSPSLQEGPDGGRTGAHGLELAVNQFDQDHGVVAIEGSQFFFMGTRSIRRAGGLRTTRR